MKRNPLAKGYARLTAEERFRLILSASGRGDESERNRLTNAGKTIPQSVQDHSPYARAFDELALTTFMDLVEHGTRYLEGIAGARGKRRDSVEDELEDELVSEEVEMECPTWRRYLDLALADGFTLRTKVEGWKLFCERLTIPHFLLWQHLPGFDRLQCALTLAEKAAFTSEGFRCWLNRIRPAGAPECKEVALSIGGVAAEFEAFFRERAQGWGA